MSDEAVAAALRIIHDLTVPAREGSQVRPDDTIKVARALLAREADRDAVIDECAKVVDKLRFRDGGLSGLYFTCNIAHAVNAIRALKTAGQPSADGGKEKP